MACLVGDGVGVVALLPVYGGDANHSIAQQSRARQSTVSIAQQEHASWETVSVL